MLDDEPMLFSLTVVPVGSGAELAGPVAEAVRLIDASGLPYQVTGTSTVIEGAWDEVMPVLREAVQGLAEDHERVYAQISVDYHGGRTGRIEGAVADVERELGRPGAGSS